MIRVTQLPRLLPLALVLAGIAAVARDGVAQAVAVTGATVIDPGSSTQLAATTIVIENGRVTAIGAGARIPAGAAVLDARGKFVIPGLWDMHAHLAALTPVGRAPERYVGHGVLNVRDMGGYLDSLVPLRAAIRSGVRTGPELVLAGPTLNSIQPAPFHRLVVTETEARAAVGELASAGVDFIKIHRATNRDAFAAIADESRKVGLPFAGHVPLAMTWVEASAAGMRTIEHIQTMFENLQPDPQRLPAEFAGIAERLDGALGDSIFGVLARNGTYFAPTLIGYEASFTSSTAAVAAARRAAFERMKPIVTRAVRAGVPIVTGTDVLDGHGEMLIRELERLVEIGMTPAQVLRAATSVSAGAARRPDLGRVAVGAPASFLVLDADPRVSIGNARALFAVVHQGRVFTAADLAQLRAP